MGTQHRFDGNPAPPKTKDRGRYRLGASLTVRTGRLLILAALLVLPLPAFRVLSTSSNRAVTGSIVFAQDSNSRATERGQDHSSATASQHLNFQNTDPKVRYLGSKACESCHESEYRSFLQTPHAQSATTPEGRSELRKLPSEGVTVCQSGGQTCFRVFPAKDGYYMSQFDRTTGGGAARAPEAHVETEKIAFALGTPPFATGYLVQRGEFLFEAPLTYYTVPTEGHVQGWGISPGYGNDSVGFTRPVVGSCLTCHVGRLRPTDAASNRYQSPPFEELAIGCESCHGPGELHIAASHTKPSQGIDSSIVNPKHLPSQLADETCAYCHELGQARVPLPGRSFQDYRPGVPLLRTQAIFKSKLLLGWNLEEWSDEMATSACYRFSKGALRCSTCHDPHFTPSVQEAPAFYRSKCLTCHQSSSCTLPLSERQHTQPADNCITCHMPEHVAPKLVKVGGRGTSHRIMKNDNEPLPPLDTPQTSPDPATGLILMNSDSPDAQRYLPRAVLLSGYQGVLARDQSRADLVEHYRTLLGEMTDDQGAPSVLSALAGAELAKRTPEGDRQAIKYLGKAVDLDSKSPKDYLLLSDLRNRTGDTDAAIKVLLIAIERFPYNPAPYEKLVNLYTQAGDTALAARTLQRGLQLFPSDKNLLQHAAGARQP